MHTRRLVNRPLFYVVLGALAFATYFASEVAYAPSGLASPVPITFANECFRVTHVIPGFGQGYRIGLSSFKRCDDVVEGRASLFGRFVDESYVDFYAVQNDAPPRFLYSELSGRLTQWGVVFGFALLIILSATALASYQYSRVLKEQTSSRAILMRLLTLAQLCLMLGLVVFAANVNRFRITEIQRQHMGVVVEAPVRQ